MNTKHDYIAVFDSGVGGISVLRHLRRLMPGERYLYFGDSANAPYGSRTTGEVRELTLAAAKKLTTEYPVKALVIACNTATAAAVKDVRAAYPDLIVIGIEPALKVAADHFPGGRVGVMATEVTLREEKFDLLLHRFDENCTIAKIPAPGLVQLIEAGKVDGPEMEALLRTILAPYIGKLDALVLGCTHYPFASGAISRVLGSEVALLEGGGGTARETKRRLAAADLLENGSGEMKILNSARDETMIRLSWERFSQM
ncbi:MAG: glutamate racemase [Oscillospiraceae bacterium]|nr:glutamate racemase [Oscillospiraceae bacterium]